MLVFGEFGEPCTIVLVSVVWLRAVGTFPTELGARLGLGIVSKVL